MKKCIKTIALCMVLGATVGCQKELDYMPNSTIGESETIYSLQYYVNGEPHTITLHGDAALRDFLQRMMALAREGYNVSVLNGNGVTFSKKEVVTYTTTSESDALQWAEKMVQDHYIVNIAYDPKTGIYTCTAIK